MIYYTYLVILETSWKGVVSAPFELTPTCNVQTKSISIFGTFILQISYVDIYLKNFYV